MTEPGMLRRRLLMLAPLGVVAAGGAAFWAMLTRMQSGRFDPHAIGNPMLGKKLPAFDLPSMPPGKGFSSGDLLSAAATKPVLVNFFASWCIPCAAEADILAAVAGQGVPVWGVAYKDAPEKSAAFLTQYGNPYARLAADADGRAAIDWGLYGVPESFLIGRAGTVAWHMAGPLNDAVVQNQLMPALKAAA